MQYRFDWDPVKEKTNTRKHSVAFQDATTVFRDSNALSVYDEEHSEQEHRWVTIGSGARGSVLVVVHTFEQSEMVADVRIISARKATRKETAQYRKGIV